MNDYCEKMFFVPLIHIEVRNWKEKKKELNRLYEKRKLNHDGTIHTDYHSQLNDCKFDCNEILEKLFQEELKELYNHIDVSFKIDSSWFETAEKGDLHLVHNHGSTGYSAVCYIDYDQEKHTPTHFIAPFSNFMNGNILEYKPNVFEGSLIFFPSTILHYTELNHSDVNRTILSFNLKVDKF